MALDAELATCFHAAAVYSDFLYRALRRYQPLHSAPSGLEKVCRLQYELVKAARDAYDRQDRKRLRQLFETAPAPDMDIWITIRNPSTGAGRRWKSREQPGARYKATHKLLAARRAPLPA